jgi:hypothetical protein
MIVHTQGKARQIVMLGVEYLLDESFVECPIPNSPQIIEKKT